MNVCVWWWRWCCSSWCIAPLRPTKFLASHFISWFDTFPLFHAFYFIPGKWAGFSLVHILVWTQQFARIILNISTFGPFLCLTLLFLLSLTLSYFMVKNDDIYFRVMIHLPLLFNLRLIAIKMNVKKGVLIHFHFYSHFYL